MIEACGWEIIKDRPFASRVAPNRRRLESVFGGSSACLASILSGAWPERHRHWCHFVYDPPHSPFKPLQAWRWLPNFITRRRCFRHGLSAFVRRQLKLRGDFDLCNLPFRHLSLFDMGEKKSPLQPGGLNRGLNIFDFLESSGIPYHVSDPALGESENFQELLGFIDSEWIDFAFVYWPELLGLVCRTGSQSPGISLRLRQYEAWIDRLLAVARKHYEDVRLYIFSGHGMANCDKLLDLKSLIEQLPLRFGVDYAAVYDSTMARFWFFRKQAREIICRCLDDITWGRVLPDRELQQLHCFFPDRRFGELIFLVEEGVLIAPSHLDERPLRAMSGYHPAEPHSYAALVTNQAFIPAEIQAIPDLYQLMAQDAKLANRLNEHLASEVEFSSLAP